jgi:hypothetical protein
MEKETMRLGGKTQAVITKVVHDALAGQCTIVVPALDETTANRMFNAVSNFVEGLGGRADYRARTWRFHNGSEIRVG